ncbi:hypothetical protein CCMA1212_001784 [Trichoderma ghanense]|uniref:Uncharacterized protein n=1 Tax=Trichoderma ghanense TaxID=65468 RepID=A0ABY2HFR7_9HYPO
METPRSGTSSRCIDTRASAALRAPPWDFGFSERISNPRQLRSWSSNAISLPRIDVELWQQPALSHSPSNPHRDGTVATAAGCMTGTDAATRLVLDRPSMSALVLRRQHSAELLSSSLSAGSTADYLLRPPHAASRRLRSEGISLDGSQRFSAQTQCLYSLKQPPPLFTPA